MLQRIACQPDLCCPRFRTMLQMALHQHYYPLSCLWFSGKDGYTELTASSEKGQQGRGAGLCHPKKQKVPIILAPHAALPQGTKLRLGNFPHLTAAVQKARENKLHPPWDFPGDCLVMNFGLHYALFPVYSTKFPSRCLPASVLCPMVLHLHTPQNYHYSLVLGSEPGVSGVQVPNC